MSKENFPEMQSTAILRNPDCDGKYLDVDVLDAFLRDIEGIAQEPMPLRLKYEDGTYEVDYGFSGDQIRQINGYITEHQHKFTPEYYKGSRLHEYLETTDQETFDLCIQYMQAWLHKAANSSELTNMDTAYFKSASYSLE